MRFEFIVDEHVKVKTFLKKHEVSKGLLATVSYTHLTLPTTSRV